MKLFVKNIEQDINEAQLENLFSKFGEVISVKIVYDKITWESKGFGFVEMTTKTDAYKAIDALHGKEIKGKVLSVEIALEKPR